MSALMATTTVTTPGVRAEPETDAGEPGFHPVANIFPLLEGGELAKLADDIAANGQRERIWLHRDGRIVDGRNRWLACRRLGVACKARTYEGDDDTLVRFVVSLNLHRRHLSESQRAMAAARIANLGHGQKKADAPIGVSQPEAADMLNVGHRSAQRAKTVQDHGAPELVAAVDRGEVKVGAAAAVAALPPVVQVEIVAEGTEAARKIRAKEGARNQYTGDNEWHTPGEWVERVRAVLGDIDLDPASNDVAQETVKADRYFTAETNGLVQPWAGRVFLNPPYAAEWMDKFVDKLLEEHQAGNVSEAILLVHNFTDTGWWHAAAGRAAAIFFTRARIRFLKPDGTGAGPTNGSTFFYFGDRPDRFAAVFGEIGLVFPRPLGNSPSLSPRGAA
jgi:phage N-6-adenine-methyltransferase